MTEAEWLACTDPDAMLRQLGPAASERKLRLFACACCRRTWHLLSDPRSQRAVEAAESYADDRIDEDKLQYAAFEAEDADGPENPGWAGPYYAACDTFDAETAAYYARVGLSPVARDAGINAVPADAPELVAEARAQAELLREIFGNPFRRPVLDAAIVQWGGGKVAQLAQAIYEDRGFDRMPILADALSEAGCTDTAILDHCHAPGTHVRGCWVLDSLIHR